MCEMMQQSSLEIFPLGLRNLHLHAHERLESVVERSGLSLQREGFMGIGCFEKGCFNARSLERNMLGLEHGRLVKEGPLAETLIYRNLQMRMKVAAGN
jgi:hypothetical protein